MDLMLVFVWAGPHIVGLMCFIKELYEGTVYVCFGFKRQPGGTLNELVGLKYNENM